MAEYLSEGQLSWRHELQKEYYDGVTPQAAFTCSILTIETLEQGLKYVQS